MTHTTPTIINLDNALRNDADAYGDPGDMTLEQWIETCDRLMLKWCTDNNVEWQNATHYEQSAAFQYACENA